MRVLLTTPPEPLSTLLPNRFVPINRFLRYLGGKKPILGVQPPYGLLYLSAYLKQSQHQVTVCDGLMISIQDLIDLIAQKKIEIVGISCVSRNWDKAKKLARLLRKTYPHLKLAIGGAHTNAIKGKALHECPEFDYAFYGDAEKVFAGVLNQLGKNQTPEPLDGLAFWKEKELVASTKSALIKDIDELPFPDREALGLEFYQPSPLSYRKSPFAAMFGARGCPFNCTFCHTENRVRMRSPENMIKEIEDLQEKYGIQEILFFDDTFTLKRSRIIRFCSLLQEKNIDLSWAASVRADTIDPEMLSQMKRAGCWRLLIGIETGVQRLLDRCCKKETLQQFQDAITMIHQAGIQAYGTFIFGFPTETYEEGLQTINFMKKLKLDYISVNNLTPFPGTAIYKEVCNQPGFKGFDFMNMFDISYVPETLTEEQLQDLLRRSIREFYLRPSYILRQLRWLKSPQDIIRYLRGGIIALLR